MKEKQPAAPPPAAENRTLDEIVASKKAKVLELKGRGVDVFPARSARADGCARVAALGESADTLQCAGRLMQIRDMGKSIFAHLQDGTGRCQIYFKKDSLTEESFALVKKDLHTGDFVSVTGPVFKTKTGEPTIAVNNVTLLAKALRPLPEKWHGLTNVDTRYRQRHLDLIANPEVRKLFEDRSKIISTVRRVLDSRGYVEVETPILLAQAGGASARPFHTHHNALGADMVLRIATELYLKRLIIGGMDKVYEIGRVFRNEGLDTRHNPEFTMLEAYEAYTDYEGMAKLFEEMVVACADAIGKTETEFNGVKIDLKKFRRIYLPEAWEKYCGEPITHILEGKGFNRQGLTRLAAKVGAHADDKTPSAKLFERIFDAKILEHLDPLTFVFDHPTAITPLAKLKPGSEGLVERFECYGAKQELSNAYSELNDPLDQRDRLAEQAKQKKAGDDEADMLDEDFVQALECGMPPTGGIGVGIDRLAMILTGHASIREVIPFPTLKPEGAE